MLVMVPVVWEIPRPAPTGLLCSCSLASSVWVYNSSNSTEDSICETRSQPSLSRCLPVAVTTGMSEASLADTLETFFVLYGER